MASTSGEGGGPLKHQLTILDAIEDEATTCQCARADPLRTTAPAHVLLQHERTIVVHLKGVESSPAAGENRGLAEAKYVPLSTPPVRLDGAGTRGTTAAEAAPIYRCLVDAPPPGSATEADAGSDNEAPDAAPAPNEAVTYLLGARLSGTAVTAFTAEACIAERTSSMEL
eukprot:CAMPEP_0204579422 /NCGR_PEP_ID=MMETSP0661-20131031/43478_1 /ASSEMBLY_ACC=CAM_ASM_000606 /TAXON_ID=109239 /ORGANISM="Alexandrium margalefi, Strain AMGDE01CS-322" /LENGTH=169 /DNA_ID=CAMNT_0051588429 /DNA_START=225 /DNA_END=734 /DNA_ORIENTATION=-